MINQGAGLGVEGSGLSLGQRDLNVSNFTRDYNIPILFLILKPKYVQWCFAICTFTQRIKLRK